MPRVVPVNELPAGSGLCHVGFAKMLLKPPPENVQATSANLPPGLNTLELLHFAAMPAFAYGVRAWFVVAFGSVHRYVPPTAVTSGSEAGQPTVGCSMNEPPLPTGV